MLPCDQGNQLKESPTASPSDWVRSGDPSLGKERGQSGRSPSTDCSSSTSFHGNHVHPDDGLGIDAHLVLGSRVYFRPRVFSRDC